MAIIALWSVDMALPEADPDPLLIRYLRTTAARAYATANGIRKGVVHLNMPFRKPLEPTVVVTDKTDFPPLREDDRPFTEMTLGGVANYPGLETLAKLIDQHEKGIIVCGPRCPGGAFSEAVALLSKTSAYPIFADPLSGVRFGAWVHDTAMFGVFGAYETFFNVISPDMLRDDAPDVVIRFGQVPTSKWLNEYLERTQPKHCIQVSESGVWADDLHLTTEFVQSDPKEFCHALEKAVSKRLGSDWWRPHSHLEDYTWTKVEEALNSGDDFDGAFVYDLIEALPENAHLFVGNSLAIRHVDQFGKPSAKNIHVFGNRGASGIDGNVSTALGVASQTDEPLVLLIGDITFYHDMNGLLAIRNLNLNNVTIVLMNNNGGGIFNRLPISGYDPAFTDLFIMPHDLEFEHAAKLYGLDVCQHGKTRRFPSIVKRQYRQRRPAHHRSPHRHSAR